MKVLDLRCSHGHGFEGWFASGDDFEHQLAGGLIECPVCNSRSIVKLLSAPRLNMGSVAPTVPAPQVTETPEGNVGQAGHAAAQRLSALRRLLAETEDVGNRFPEEARRMHYGEAPERAIRGQATVEQANALQDEGIEVVALPTASTPKAALH